MSDISYTVKGIFYSKRDGLITGEATYTSKNWIIKRDNSQVTFSRSTIYLDRNKLVPAPTSELDKENFRDLVKQFIDKYEAQLAKYTDRQDLKDVSPSYDMGHMMAKGYLVEYKRIYVSYFRSNAVKFMFDDWVNGEE